MPRFRKKPVVVEAMQWGGGATAASLVIDWVLTLGGYARYVDRPAALEKLHIETLEGMMYAEPGDWIIRGVEGFYPCKPDIFEATYEPVDPRPMTVEEMVDAYNPTPWQRDLALSMLEGRPNVITIGGNRSGRSYVIRMVLEIEQALGRAHDPIRPGGFR